MIKEVIIGRIIHRNGGIFVPYKPKRENYKTDMEYIEAIGYKASKMHP